ncbi:MAG: flagellar motor switch protein FliM [Syntrophorhabdaceae bacterium]|nr:flagellar motor switch protein FliM [Syntrophorhabdaceae bacterium]
MEQILTQEEIDALLEGLSDGNIEIEQKTEEPVPSKKEIEVKAFDFVKYSKMRKDKLPALQFVYDRFSKSFRTALVLFMEREIDMEQGTIQYIQYDEFIKTLPLPTNMNIIVTDRLKGFFIVIFDAKLIFSVLETIFGSASVTKTKIEGREFTKIELGVIKKLLELFCVEMEKAWAPVYEITCKYSRSEMNPNYITMISPEEIVSVCEFSVDIEGVSGWMKVCIPYSILETIKGYLISTPSREDMEMREKWCSVLKERVYCIPLEVRAILGKRKMSLNEFLKVTKDNIIMIDRHVNDPVDLLVENRSKFKGRLGVMKGNKAIMIEEVVR